LVLFNVVTFEICFLICFRTFAAEIGSGGLRLEF
jgi:hypothetical protein